MNLVKPNLKCGDCIRPVARRLGLFQAKDDYECYAESYVKCFWGLCDHQKSVDNFTAKSDGKVITKQPRCELLSDTERNMLQYKEIVLSSKRN